MIMKEDIPEMKDSLFMDIERCLCEWTEKSRAIVLRGWRAGWRS